MRVTIILRRRIQGVSMKKKKFLIGNSIGIGVSLVVLVTLNVVCLGTSVRGVISTYLGGSGLQGGSDEEISNAYQNALDTCDDILDEGMVLLKNENSALPLSTAGSTEEINVNVFGYSSINTYYGGSGSGASDYENSETLLESFTDAGLIYNQDIIDLMQNATVDTDVGNPLWGTFYPAIPELTVDQYEANIASYKSYSDIAIINIGRTGGEGMDLPSGQEGEMKDQSGEGTEVDYLELSQNEIDLIELCENNFSKVIVCVNAANPLELGILEDEGVDAAVWYGHPGAYGLSELPKLLRGDVNPSGRLVDTYAYDSQSAPSYLNSGAAYTYQYTNVEGGYYVEYQEGIYVGYKYYETKYVDSEADYQEAVLYPFGYGLSYSDFDWEITGRNLSDEDNLSITVEVTNNGAYAGKDVVELYFAAPYTAGGIEKAAKNLVAFAKTDLIQPNESATVELEFSLEDMASYDYDDANSNRHTGYEAEAGTYDLYVSTNAHDVVETVEYEVDNTVYFDTSSTGYTIQNQFDNAAGDVKFLTRADNFTSNYPSADRQPEALGDSYVEALSHQFDLEEEADAEPIVTDTITHYVDAEERDENGDIVYDEEGNPVYQTNSDGSIAQRGLYLEDMAGLDYDDPLWDDLLNQMSMTEIQELIAYGGYSTHAVESINKSQNRDLDGPQGINFSNVSSESLTSVCSYPAEINVASTWNKDLAYAEGEAFAAEANASGVTSVYAPACNTHRSAYGGRNFEYYSEDGVLSGFMCANFVKAARDNGLNCYVKHFALNDQDTQRCGYSDNAGLFTWSNEQAIREIYLKPFQMAVEDGGTLCIMSSFNRIGYTWAGANYGLLTEVLRNEWGFRGTVLTDYYMYFYSYMNVDAGLRAGNDCYLAGMEMFGTLPDVSTATNQQYCRRACHNILYSVANSQSAAYITDESWLYWFIPVDVVLFVGVAAWAGIVAWKVIKANKKGGDDTGEPVPQN